ncbi:hypothetical protein J7T55_011351 [Diaporthe amygdali]|uniref:uncharacterized protein n=1 Tax=Phomopsis amygdali TaxID=1214568 RepID=UPI0022FF35CB|nr:uncharacterized protein J7T55_011351 [Diaporthe amygdali]KAJ0108857.1 hypothetical protein J7T55_011351 [Diaporthe amygdali]
MMAVFDTGIQGYDGISRIDLQSWVQLSTGFNIEVPFEVLHALQGRSKDSELFFNALGPNAQLQEGDRAGWDTAHLFYNWIHMLTISMAPRLSHLQMTLPFGSFEDLQSTPPKFPQIRVLTYGEFDKIQVVARSLVHFPNVSSLHIHGHSNVQREEFEDISLIPTLKISKLSISCAPGALSFLLQFCPQLEDLEYHAEPSRHVPESPTSLSWPTQVRDNLRRLAWSNKDSRENLLNDNIENAFIPPLHDFNSLEILEIDLPSLILHSKLPAASLPTSLRILHLAFARDIFAPVQISRKLRELTRAKSAQFPKLSIIKIDQPVRPMSKKRTLADAMRNAGVVRLMDDADIHLRFGWEKRYTRKRERCILPPPPGAAVKMMSVYRDIDYQREVFSLEDVDIP